LHLLRYDRTVRFSNHIGLERDLMASVAKPTTAITNSSDYTITSLTNYIHAVFQCDGRFVCIDFDFYDHEPSGARYPRHFVLSSEEAILIGRQIEELGSPGEFPITAVEDDVKAFGRRLREYGETGR